MAEEVTQVQEQTTESQQPAQQPDNSLSEYFNTDPSKGGLWTNDDGSFWNEGKLYDRSGNEINPQKQQQPGASAQGEKPQQSQQPTKPNEQGSTPQPEGFESLFFETKDGKSELSVEKSMEFFGKVGQQNYEPAYQQQAAQQQQPPKAGDPIAQPQPSQEQKLDWVQEIDKTRENLRSEKLGFLEKFYAENRGQLGEQAVAALDAHYRAEEKRIEDHIRKLERDHMLEFEKSLVEKTSRKDPTIEAQEIANAYRQTFANVSKDFGGPQKLEAFLYGVRDAQGKVSKGIGAEVVDWLFDMTHSPDQLKGKDIQKYYPEWAMRTFSNEKNLRMATRLATALYALSNQAKIRDGYRAAWDKEQSQRREATGGKPSGVPTQQGNSHAQMAPELSTYLHGSQGAVDTV